MSTDSENPGEANAPSQHAGHSAVHAEAASEMLRRLKSIEGHVRGIQKMVDEDAYCIDLLKQIKAVRAAMDRVGAIALEAHLETCVTDGLRGDDPHERNRVIKEILEVFGANAKR
jgi:DNA-binding FrmR family transcriptional regulator